MDIKLKKLPFLNGMSISILIGLLVFTASFFILIKNIETGAYDNKLNIKISKGTDILHANDMILGNKKLYNDYLSLLGDSIYSLDETADILKKKYDPLTNKFQYSFDPKKITKANNTNYYFGKSKYLIGKLFYATDKDSLEDRIGIADKSILASLNESVGSEKLLKSLVSTEKVFFNRYPGFLIWTILISIAIAVSFSFIPYLLYEIRNYSSKFSSGSIILRSIIFTIVVATLSLLPLYFLANNYFDFLIKPLDTTKLFSVGISKFGLHWNSMAPYVGVLFWLVSVYLMLATSEWLYNKLKTNDPDNPVDFTSSIAEIQNIESKFESQFIALAIFLGFTIFSTDMLLGNLNNIIQLDSSSKIFPTEFSFINGLMQTFFLGIIYFYYNGGLKKIKAQAVKLKPEGLDINTLINTKQKKFLDYFKLILTILAPILGSGMQAFFKSILG